MPRSRVTALDRSPQLLRRLREAAERRGTADRLGTVETDLDAPWPDLGPSADLAWASASLHHLADPDGTLRRTFAALRPGGLLAVVEPDGLPRFLPADLGTGRPGLEDRCRALTAPRTAEAALHPAADWAPALERAGFTVEAEQRYAPRPPRPLPDSVGRYAHAVLTRLRAALDGRLDPEDTEVLDLLLDPSDPEGVLSRQDLDFRTERTLWVARRPPVSG
ncbi:class I SAM-dependent methyltransferase [Kitasatospora camelliae]|uniref:Class I SAM-dependent methyltransferase n=1 Tax=Kitasatospora camelliae TaxID=3156397 RepID=A0AAU8K781_9ACTN